MKGPITTLINPENQDEKEFAFDYSYWSHDGFETDDTGYNESVPGSSQFGAAARPKKVARGCEVGMVPRAAYAAAHGWMLRADALSWRVLRCACRARGPAPNPDPDPIPEPEACP